MKIPGSPRHLTYCTNIHPGESWAEVEKILFDDVLAVKRRIAPGADFGVGLRLAARACRELEASGELARVRADLAAAGLYVFTLNGFPFGTFHGTRVKEAVYRPDWLESERVDYTSSLARVLAGLLPDGLSGSISTVPGCFRPRASEPRAAARIAAQIGAAAADLVAIERDSGRHITLALEPEPCCLLETSAEAVAFFEGQLFDPESLRRFATRCRIDVEKAESTLRRYVGVCLDACHASVEFEHPLDAFRRLVAAGIRIPKIQVTAGLVLERADREGLAAFAAFAEETYLHQAVVKSERGLSRFVDLGPALEAAHDMPPDTEWRVHFHVPVFESRLTPFSSTQRELYELLTDPGVRGYSAEFEVETYTFDVLPEQYRNASVDEAIARELSWTLDALTR